MIAIGLVLTAVFVPCAFITGIIGQFFRQFALTIATSTLISAFNSLTLSARPWPRSCSSRGTSGERTEALPRLAYVLLGGWLGYELPRAGGRRALTEDSVAKLPYAAEVGGAARSARSAGWLVGPLIDRLLVGHLPALQRRRSSSPRTSTRDGRRPAPGQPARAARLRRAALPDLLRVHEDARPASSRRRTRAICWSTSSCPTRPRSSTPARDEADRGDRQRDRRASAHTVAIAGQSLLLNANAPNFGSMYVMLDDFHHRDQARADRRRDRREARGRRSRTRSPTA